MEKFAGRISFRIVRQRNRIKRNAPRKRRRRRIRRREIFGRKILKSVKRKKCGVPFKSIVIDIVMWWRQRLQRGKMENLDLFIFPFTWAPLFRFTPFNTASRGACVRRDLILSFLLQFFDTIPSLARCPDLCNRQFYFIIQFSISLSVQYVDVKLLPQQQPQRASRRWSLFDSGRKQESMTKTSSAERRAEVECGWRILKICDTTSSLYWKMV